ncbi:MAG: hydrogenase maturation peptidase HycI [Methanobrevibacter sp.]
MFKKDLEEFLKDYNRLVILGIGNDIRGDDGVGQYIVESLKDLGKESDDVIIINAKTVPENFTGKIRKIDPSHILIIDAVLMNEEPGTIRVISKEQVGGLSVSTHSMSLSFLIKYLEIEKPYNIVFLGIQPESMGLVEDMSKVCKDSSDNVIDVLDSLL